MANNYTLTIDSLNAFVGQDMQPLASGTILIESVDGTNNPIPFRVGNDNPLAQAQAVKTRVLRTITNGTIDGVLTLANPAFTNPEGIGYTFTVTDASTGSVTVFPAVLIGDNGNGHWYIGALPTGETINAMPVVKITGPAGPAGIDGVASVAALARTQSRLPSSSLGNVFDITKARNGYVRWQDGVFVADTNFTASAIMPANAGDIMSAAMALLGGTGPGGAAFYDENDQYVSGLNAAVAAGGNFQVPANAAGVAVTMNGPAASFAQQMIYWGALPSDGLFHAFGTYDKSQVDSKIANVSSQLAGANATALVNDAVTRAALLPGVNYFDKSQAQTGYYVDRNTGNVVAAGGFTTSGKIPTNAGGKMTCNKGLIIGAAAVVYFNAQDQMVGETFDESLRTAKTPWTAPINSTYMLLTVYTSDADTCGVFAGTTAPDNVPFGIPGLVQPLLAGPLYGKKVGMWGDSWMAVFNQLWQNAFLNRTGANLVMQDARPGRTVACALEGYGASYPLASLSALTGYTPSTSTNGDNGGFSVGGTLANYNTVAGAVPTTGNTLAQNLAGLDLLIVALGTNDVSLYGSTLQGVGKGPIGAATDAYTARTEWAALNFFLDALSAAAPTLPVFWVGHTFVTAGADTTGSNSTNADGTGSTLAITPGTTNTINAATYVRNTRDAVQQACGSRGKPYLDLVSNGQINSSNFGKLLRDGTHATDPYFVNRYAPGIASFASRWF